MSIDALRKPSRRLAAALAGIAVAAAAALWGCGGSGSSTEATVPALGPSDLAVLVAEGDATSEAIAAAYVQARGVPAANVVRVPVSTGADALSLADFQTMKATLDARLPAGVQALLVTWTRPSRVTDTCTMSLTSALALGYDAGRCGRCTTTQASAYYDSESAKPWTDLGVRPAMMLGASDLASARALIARGVAADGSMKASGAPTAHAWLIRTQDADRSVRYPDFQQVAAATPVSGLTVHYVDNASGRASDWITGQSQVMFYWTGLASVPAITSNGYLPGAVADHLTSTAGLLPDANGQMPVTDWLNAGVTGSYGTVEEPCNYVQKFPRASVMLRHYLRGETLIEAYWKSVQWPGEGLFVGEPLARPWGR